MIRPILHVLRQPGKIPVSATRECFVQHHPQRKNIRARRAGAFRRNVPLRAHARHGLVRVRHQPQIGQFRTPLHENDVRRLDVPMDQPVFVQIFQGHGQRQADFTAFAGGNAPAPHLNLALERAGDVCVRLDVPSAGHIVRHFHNIIEISRLIPAAHEQNLQLVRGQPGNRLKFQNARIFPFVRPVILKRNPVNHLHRAIAARFCAGQIHLPITAAPNRRKNHLVIQIAGENNAGVRFPSVSGRRNRSFGLLILCF